jgi:vacuolar-type H+-ATPase subunit I/STV1
MTYQAPPPPPGAYPPPGGPAKPAFDPKTVDPMDWAIIGAGILSLIFSFFAYYKYKASYSIGGASQSISASASAWHGFFGWFAAIVALAAAAILAIELFMPGTLKLPIPARTITLAGFALATLCVLLAFFIHPGTGASVSGPGYSAKVGHGFSYFVTLILVIAGTVLSFLRLKATGGALPWEKGTPPAAPGGYPPPAPGGYPPPPPPGYPPAQ